MVVAQVAVAQAVLMALTASTSTWEAPAVYMAAVAADVYPNPVLGQQVSAALVQ
jgi:hypothetical protein